MKLSPFISLTFNGQCETAFKFYEKCLDAKIGFLLKWGQSPRASTPPAGFEDKILYGRIVVGDTELIGADVLPSQYQKPQGFVVMLDLDDPAMAERIFRALSENGTVRMPL